MEIVHVFNLLFSMSRPLLQVPKWSKLPRTLGKETVLHLEEVTLLN